MAWSTVTPRIYISQLQGTVQSANKTYIMSSYSGQITELTISEGSYVEQGDLIAHIKSTDIDIQQSQLENQLAIYQTQLAQYNKLIQSIQDNTNYFSESDPADQTYYYQYENYQSQVAQHTFDSSAYRAAGYSEAQIQSMMEQNQRRAGTAVLLRPAVRRPEREQRCRPILKNITVPAGRPEHRRQRLLYIYAPHLRRHPHGQPLQRGQWCISAGSVLATVASENADYEIVAYAGLSDRPLLDVGDPCTIAITGLAQTAYGTLTGTVTAIDSDVTTSNGTSFYKVTVKPDSTYLISKSGDQVDLANGNERHRPASSTTK